MSETNPGIPCLGELTVGYASAPKGAARRGPACDFAEARVWDALGGGWQCLHGCYCQQGVSIEWQIYVAKCAKCHRFYEPTNHSESDWRTWMEKMNKKSKLKEDQAGLLTRYLDAYRAGQLPGKPQDKPKSTLSGTAAR